MLDARTTSAIQSAMAAARTGDIGRARQLAEGALAAGGDEAALNAFLGMVLARTGDQAGAIRHLGLAHGARPKDVTIACNLIAALIETGQCERALALATWALATADGSLRVARYRGFLAQSLEQFDEAIKAYAFVVARAPDDFESWNNLGNAYAAIGNQEESVRALRQAVVLNRAAAPMRLNLASALVAAGNSAEAETVLREAMFDFPEDALASDALHALLHHQFRYEDALDAISKAVKRDSANADYRLKLGIAFGEMARVDDAEAAYREAIRLDPVFRDAYLGLAIHYEHTNREEEFAPLVAMGVANGLDEGALAFISALDHRRARRDEEALACLVHVPPSIEPQRSAHLRAGLLDRLGRTDVAFAAYQEANDLHAANASNPIVRAAAYRAEIADEIALMTTDWRDGWTNIPSPEHRRDPVFLVGFPRSGTTLLDTFLMGHPDVIVLEERPPLNHVDREIGGLRAIATLDAEAAGRARERYFEEVQRHISLPAGAMLIDKSPLFLMKVPLIQRLFPNARFVLAMRHPCDVLLSCFMSNFRLNTAMSNFLRLEDAAAFYDLAFRHWQTASALFGPNVHTVIYERLVENPTAELRPLFDFLGLDWHDAALDHRRTAKARGLITTASYAQVAEPIYTSSAGRWRRYRQHLEPVMPVLAPWVDTFGYRA